MCVKCQNVYIIQVNAEIRCLWENIFVKGWDLMEVLKKI